MEDDAITWIQWLTLVEIPALAGLALLVWRQRDIVDRKIEALKTIIDQRVSAERTKVDELRENLSSYKLEAAHHYASIGYLKDVEQRLVDHLLRIEGKLDGPPRQDGPSKPRSRTTGAD